MKNIAKTVQSKAESTAKGKVSDGVSNIKDKAKNTLDKIFNLPQPEGETTAWMVLDGKDYELRAFVTEFGQACDHKGQPQHEVKGGLLHISLYQIPDDVINRWMLRPSVRKSGEIQFRLPSSSMPLRIVFTDAQCVSYEKEIGYKDIGFEAKLILSPKEISLNGTSQSNNGFK
jgi:hypothetical protein